MRRALIRLLTHPLVLLLLVAFALRAGYRWFFLRPPSERSMMIGAATVIDLHVAKKFDYGRGMCADACAEPYAIAIERVERRRATWESGSMWDTDPVGVDVVDVEVSFQPPGPPSKARERLVVRFWQFDISQPAWRIEPLADHWGCSMRVMVSETEEVHEGVGMLVC